MRGLEGKVTPNKLCGELVERVNSCQIRLGTSELGLKRAAGIGNSFVYLPHDNPFVMGRGKTFKNTDSHFWRES